MRKVNSNMYWHRAEEPYSADRVGPPFEVELLAGARNWFACARAIEKPGMGRGMSPTYRTIQNDSTAALEGRKIKLMAFRVP